MSDNDICKFAKMKTGGILGCFSSSGPPNILLVCTCKCQICVVIGLKMHMLSVNLVHLVI